MRTRAAAGRYRQLAVLPGFTRGLDFHGPLAFIGLSQVRETAVFSGLPITEPARERYCGVWVVDLRDGQTVAFARFEDRLQEIFAVQVLPDIRFPELLNDGQDELVKTHSYSPTKPCATRRNNCGRVRRWARVVLDSSIRAVGVRVAHDP